MRQIWTYEVRISAKIEDKLIFQSVVNRATDKLSSAVFGMDGNSVGTTLPSELRFAMRFLVAAVGVTIAASLDILAGPGLHTMFYLPAILLVTLLADTDRQDQRRLGQSVSTPMPSLERIHFRQVCTTLCRTTAIKFIGVEMPPSR